MSTRATNGVATPRLLRRLNAAQVLEVMRRSGPLRVTDLVAATGMSRPTVDAVADDLVRLGWLAEVGGVQTAKPARGRPARLLAFRGDAGWVAGIDIGHAKVRAAVADLRGEVVAERLREFATDLSGRERLTIIRRLARTTIKAAGIAREDVLASCVGCTGGMDSRTGDVLFTNAFPGLEHVNLREELEPALGAPVLVDNDCNLAVIGERWLGVAQGVDDAICVLAGERLGAGILVGGRLVRGHAGAAGEMAFLGAYEDHHGAEGVAYLVRTFGTEALGREVQAEDVFAAARDGDPVAAGVIERSVASAGRAIVTMALVLNPELVVIGGGVAGAGEALLSPLRRQLERMARLPPRIEASPLGARGPLLGAIRAALDRVEAQVLDDLHSAVA